MVRIGFIGSGNMGSALVTAIIKKRVAQPKEITTSDVSKERLAELSSSLGVNTTSDNNEVVKSSDIFFLAVKPQDMEAVLSEIKDSVEDKILISIAAGITIEQIRSVVGDKKIVRLMPNLPCLVGQMTGGFDTKNLTEEEEKAVMDIFSTAGEAHKLDESLIDVVAALSGSGPAFVSQLIKNFTEAGVENGLPRDIAYALSRKTFEGTARFLDERKMNPEELIKLVSSPGGITISAMEVLEPSDVQQVIKDTVKRAIARSKELGK